MRVQVHRAPGWVFDTMPLPDPEGPRDEALAALVDDLAEPYRSVVEAVFWEQVPRRELARRLGIPRSAIERLYREALDILGQPGDLE